MIVTQRERRAAGHDQDDRRRQERSGAPPRCTDRTSSSAQRRFACPHPDRMSGLQPIHQNTDVGRRNPSQVSLQPSVVAVADLGDPAVRPSDVFAVDRDLAAPGRGVLGAAATVRRSEDWRREVALRLALASLPCTVLILYLPAILGRGGTSWVVPLAMAFANAWLAVSVARELLRGRWFLVFWALYGLAWIAVAWHGAHFHRPPRPAALLMNLEEILETPFPAWSEM